jgi:polyisoprenoid-binding protein YceI
MMRALAQIALALSLFMPAAATAQSAQPWELVQDQSSISYINPAVAGGAVPIKVYNAKIIFDPDQLSQSGLLLLLDVSALYLDGKDVPVAELQKMAPTTEIIEESPGTAVFISDDVRRGKGNIFEFNGKLTANKVTRPMTLPLTASVGRHPSSGQMMLTLTGEFTANRSEFTTQPMGATGPALIPFQVRISGVAGPGK